MPHNISDPKKRADSLYALLKEDGASTLEVAIKNIRIADLATTLEYIKDEEKLHELFLAFPPFFAAEVLEEVSPELRDHLLEDASDEHLCLILSEAYADDAVYFLDHLEDDRIESILSNLDSRVRKKLEDQYELPEDAAGHLMTRKIFTLHPFSTVSQALNKLKSLGEKDYGAIYVVNANSILIGVLSFRDLVFADPTTKISQLMNSDIISVNENEDVEIVAQLMRKYHFFAIPVTNDEGHIRGMITWDDAADILAAEAEEDILAVAGTAEDLDDNDSIFGKARLRLPYLLVTAIGGFIMATMIDSHKDIIKSYGLLIAFLPLIPALAGNVGIQCSTVTLKSIVSGEITKDRMKSRAFRELNIGVLLSIVLAIICGAGALLMIQMNSAPLFLAGIITVSLLFAIVMAACFGVLVPLLCLRINIDPAIAAGPFITMLNDISGMAVYLSTAYLLLP